MDKATEYWTPLFELVSRLRCWLQVGWRDGDLVEDGFWGMGFGSPVAGYLEGPGVLVYYWEVEWIELSTKIIHGGMAGRPLRFVDIKDQILEGLSETHLSWEIRQTKWSVDRIFVDEPVEVFRLANPFAGNPDA